MKVLAIETSSAEAGIAVADSDRIVAARKFETPRGRGADLFTALEKMRNVWRGIDRLAIGIGPGSYNGLRAACALAGSFQMALGIDLVAVPSCCLLDVGETDYIAAGDARGGRLWRAEVSGRALAAEIALMSPGELRQSLYAEPRPSYRVGAIRGFEDLRAAVPDAEVLALSAASLPPCDPAALVPLYLKPPHITLPREPRA